jgi:hypothetical protein
MSEEENNEFEFQMNRLFWKIMKCLGLPMLGMLAAVSLFWATTKAHTSDGHPETVKLLVHAQDIRTARVETKVDALIESITRIEKKIDEDKLSGVSLR